MQLFMSYVSKISDDRPFGHGFAVMTVDRMPQSYTEIAEMAERVREDLNLRQSYTTEAIIPTSFQELR